MTKKISIIFGTRPEAIKLAPVVLALRSKPEFESHVCVTGQHRKMLDQVLNVFGIRPDTDLKLMQPNQSLADLTIRAIAALDTYLKNYKPDFVLVQGDTTTVFCAALVAFYNQVPLGHVEAGLRTWNKYSPFPEEKNRVVTSHLADIHFAPTEKSRHNLEKEGISPKKIYVTGNTVIDAFLLALEKIKRNPPHISSLPDYLQPGKKGNCPLMILITGHRRENFGKGLERICSGIRRLAETFPDIHFVYPLHLNPNVREPVSRLFGEARLANIHLIEPLPYLPMIALMKRSFFIMTDSGGIQEEAPTLGKPVLVMRDTTERPEGVETGVAKLVGTDADRIFQAAKHLLNDCSMYQKMAQQQNPYGDGRASERIVNLIMAEGLAEHGL